MLIDISISLNTGRPFFLFLQTVCFERMERVVLFSLGMLPDEVFLAISGCYHRNTLMGLLFLKWIQLEIHLWFFKLHPEMCFPLAEVTA